MSDETKSIISKKAKIRYQDKTATPMYSKKHTKEALTKQRECKLGDKNPMYGSKWNDKQKQKCGTKGKKLNLSDEQRKTLSERGRRIGETVGLRPVQCLDDGIVFKSVKEAAEYYGVSPSTLCGHLKGSQKTCHKKHFQYI